MPKKPDSEVTHGFGQRIRALRKRAGLSQSELADEIKATKGAISWWEQGFTPDCSALALYRAAHVLDTTMEYLIAGKSFKRSGYPMEWLRPTPRDQWSREVKEAEIAELESETEDAEEINNMTEAQIDEALLDAGRDPSAVVERALKLVELDTGIVEAPHD